MYKKIFKVFLISLVIILLINKYFFYFDFSNDCSVFIKPSFLELSSGNIKQAIKIIKKEAPSDYENFCKAVDVIDPNLSCGGFQGGCYISYEKNPKEIDVSTANQGFLAWTAAVIAHEACHARQFQTGGHESLNEEECYRVGDQLIKKLVQYN